MTALKLYFAGAFGKLGLADTFLSRATYTGIRQRSPEASDKYREKAIEAAKKLKERKAARTKRTA
jgi:hypothetical protein